MAKQSKARKPDNNNNGNTTIFGNGEITPVQIAFIVDRYLLDNNFSQTRSAFHSEASSLLSKCNLHQAPNSLMSLRDLLEEYISLKGQKVMIEQDKFVLNQEKSRVHSLFQGLQDLITAFNSPLQTTPLSNGPTPPPPPPPPSVPPAPPVSTNSVITSTSSASGLPAYQTPTMTTMAMTQSVMMGHTNFSTPIYNSRPPRKRKTYKDVQYVPQAPKKPCVSITTNKHPMCGRGANSVAQPSNASNGNHDVINQSPLPSLSPTYAQPGPPVQGSSVAKNLFNKPSTSPNSQSSGPKTPPRALSSQSDKSTSPLEDISSTAKSTNPPETATTNCTFISSKTIIVSPAKQYSFERNQCTFSSPVKTNQRQSKREHVKGRLDFDSSDVPTNLENTSGADGSCESTSSESEKEGDIFDLELPNFDVFGSLSELLTDFGIDCGTINYSCPTTTGASTDTVPELPQEGNNSELGASNNQDYIQHSSEVFAGDVGVNGTDSITSVKSITKCIRIVSPTKCSKNSSIQDQGSLSAES